LSTIRDRPESIAGAAQRLDVLGGSAELLAQALDVRVDGARGQARIMAPHVVKERPAGLHAAAPCEQRGQEPKLDRGEAQLLAVEPRAVAGGVDPQRAEAELSRRGRVEACDSS